MQEFAMKVNRGVLVLAALAVAACAPAFSPEALDRVDRAVTFRQLQANPDAYLGKWVLAGGIILETRNAPDGTTLEVLERPVDRQGRPRETDDSAGRFLIKSHQFLDPADFHPGKRISLIGEVAGQEVRPLGEMQYRYPLLTPKELHVWEPHTSPPVSFGFGIGVVHHF
jgi:outer membrane lipoprotein